VSDATDTDLVLFGAGPVGLYGAYYAGFRGLRTTVVDALPELGGQITAMYPASPWASERSRRPSTTPRSRSTQRSTCSLDTRPTPPDHRVVDGRK
jgi:hypothetical protein